MNTTTRRKAITITRQLSDLIDSARTLRSAARVLGMASTSKQLGAIVSTLDAARTHLVEDHDYHDTASAFVTAASNRLPHLADLIGRARNGR